MEEISEIDKIFNDVGIKPNNKLKKYSIEYKLKILKLIDLKVSLHQIEARLGISRKNLREWKDKENLLKDINKKEKRLRCDRKYGIKRSLSEDDEVMIKN